MKTRNRIAALLLLGLMSMAAFGCDSKTGTNTSPAKTEASTSAQKTADKEAKSESASIAIYIPKSDASGVVLKTVKVDADQAQDPAAWLQTAMAQDQGQEYPIFKKDMKVNSVKVDGSTATVDVNNAFVNTKRGVLTIELQMAVIVNTLIKNDDSIKQVKFTNNGKKLSLIGNYDLSEPLTFMKSMVKK